MSDSIRIEDFEKLSQLVRGYELQPGKHYLIVVDGKDFSQCLANALFHNIRSVHPELEIYVVAVTKSKKITVMEEKPCTEPSKSSNGSSE